MKKITSTFKQLWQLAFCLLVVSACTRPVKVMVAEDHIIDSIVIDSIVHANELLNISMLDSQNIVSFNRNKNTVNFYKKINGTFRIQKIQEIPFENFCMESDFISAEEIMMIDRKKDEVFIYNFRAYSLQKLNIQASLPVIKTDFIIAASQDLPVYFLDRNTFIAGIYFSSLQFYQEYYKESFLHKFYIQNDSIKSSGHFINIPPFNHGLAITGSYRIIDNKAYALFPYIDSLYIYDLKNGGEFSEYVGNAEFDSPQYWNIANIRNQKKVTQYELSNFNYRLITQDYFDANNLLLFYETAVQQKGKGNPTYKDKKLKLLVRKRDNSSSSYFIFNSSYYSPGSALTKNKKFYGLPLYNKFKKNGKVVFYIFDFNTTLSWLQ